MTYAVIAMERAMKIQEVILRAMSGALTWPQAADILGMHPRSLRRWRARQQRVGYDGLLDRRRQRPSPRLAPFAEIERILRLYRERYAGFNVRHFHQLVRRDEHVTLSYTLVKTALQKAGLVAKRRARGRHRRRREPRPCFGELLHLDGSPHAWLARCPDQRQTLIAVLDDATQRLLYAQLWSAETTTTMMSALGDVDLDQILCEEDERTVAPDNTVSFDTVRLQLAKQPGRPTCAGARVTVRRHLDGRFTVWRGPTRLGLYAASGVPVPARVEQAANGHFPVGGADRPPMRPRRIVRATAGRQRRLGPRLPVGPGF